MDRSLFEKVCSVENLFSAWGKFSRGKNTRADVMDFGHQVEDRLFAMRDELVSGTYKHGVYEAFTVYDPKQRSIHKASVRDRIVHQALVDVIEPLFEKQFIFDSFSCRLGKGTHAAVQRVRAFLRRESFNGKRTAYVLKCDVKRFFASVDHEVLLTLLRRRIHDARVMGLIQGIVGSFSTSEGKGIPLGNLTSQLFANVYLHELDRFVKHQLHQKHYARYCDDFAIVGLSRAELAACVQAIDHFLEESLLLKLHPDKTYIRTWNQGIDFLGYVLMPHCIVLRPKTARRMLKRVCKENKTSYLGMCSHADTYELQRIVLTKIA